MLGLALTAALSFAPPPDAGTEAPIVVAPPAPAPPAPPAPAPTVQTDVIVVAPAPQPRPMTTPPPIPTPTPTTPRKPMAGVGLMAAAVGVFGIGLSSQITTANSQARYCRNWSDRGYNGVHGCFYDSEPWHMHMGTGFAFGSSMVLTGIGAGALGQYHAWQSVFGDRRPRNGRGKVITGGVLAMLGVGTIIADGFLLRRELTDFCTTHECEVKRRRLYYALGDVGSAAFIAGVGMMSYGKNLRENKLKYGRNWTLTPQASPNGVGASATVRF